MPARILAIDPIGRSQEVDRSVTVDPQSYFRWPEQHIGHVHALATAHRMLCDAGISGQTSRRNVA
jgi:hypothetical protein